MQSNGFFESLGNVLGEVIRTIVSALRYLLGGIGRAIGDFSAGLAHAMGMSPNLFNFAVLLLGVLLLIAAVRALLRRSIVGFLFWAILAVLVLGALIG
ncbi:hypothetical protein [Bordetella genomosp. 9]|uniref:Uncharacterized protein n=1 Tax=Bordetella genomosp. 9 TaxID=1416803 RepID=A0A1W6Z199_9BORD|nr:hypothetical protein [Bordetella genomosp. 9]ARP87021.1 hypothetical protein CAL13_12990 [Bordetella genomosp. 9]ARP91010.1 hypothetical protein CAL14_12515 [Bordetella genomosp. 9]